MGFEAGREMMIQALIDIPQGPALGLELPANQSFEDWAATGISLASANKVLNWWIGDWWAAGSHRYGERAKVAAAGIFGREFQALADMASVCRAFETSRRREHLSFTHHREVAALPKARADALLDRAQQEGWSTRELRAEVIASTSETPKWFERQAPTQFDRGQAREAIFVKLCEAASFGEVCPTADVLAEAAGVHSVATTVDLMHDLEREGRIVVARYQRSRQVTIIETGQQTAEPSDKTPHWRNRGDEVPALTIQQIAQRAKPLAEMIEAKARSLGKPLAEFIMDCVYVGFHEICRDAEGA